LIRLSRRTFVIGDIHGQLDHFEMLWSRLPALSAEDTVVFLGDYLDRGPDSRGVAEALIALSETSPAQLVFLRGNHEDGWLRVLAGGFPQFVLPAPNGCVACFRSFSGQPMSHELPSARDMTEMLAGSFLPEHVVEWMKAMPHWYEDEHAIYVHAGLPRDEGRFLHPSEVEDPIVLLWLRSNEFFREYDGKRVVCGHTATEDLPQELSSYTPEDPSDLWFHGSVVAIDTKCGKTGGFLTAIELPALNVYESR